MASGIVVAVPFLHFGGSDNRVPASIIYIYYLFLSRINAMVINIIIVIFVVLSVLGSPAFIIGEAVALSFGAALILALLKKERRSQLVPHFRQNLKYLGIALALLLPAAIIEAYVTPLLLN